MQPHGKARVGGTARLDAVKPIALLGALCLFLSSIEYMIPKPLPFMRIGIANLPLMLALDLCGWGDFFLLVLIKILGQALVTGTLFSYVFLFSLTGTVLSAFTMFFLRRLCGSRIGFIGIGTAGAMLSNVSQLFLASFFVFGKSVVYITPPFLGAGFITGVSLGAFCEYFTGKSVWYAEIKRRVTRTTRSVHTVPRIPD
ncbi:MAG: Gx transporter family protein [Treponema sp.]|jgi:heptaprenyl diphosphate synthase|nr:Gx transporter family protein [Treponema sp.]